MALLIALAMAALFTLITSEATGMLTIGIDRSLTEQLSLLGARPPDMLPFMITSRMNGGAAVVTQVGLFDADRNPVVGSLTSIPAGLAMDGRAHHVTGAHTGVDLRAAAKTLADGRMLVVARDTTDIAEIRENLLTAGLRLALPTLALTIACGLFIGLVSEKRLRFINESAQKIIDGDLTKRLPAKSAGDELDRLCLIFNRVLSRLEEGIEALRNAGENIAHDLRTPLTSARARLERCVRISSDNPRAVELIDQAVAGVDHSLATITALLRIADLEHVRRISAFAPFPLAEMLRETVEIFTPVAEDRGVSLVCEAAPDVEALGDRGLMVEAIANIVDNALKFTPKGGRVAVVLRQHPHGPVISVSDTGPGIPAAMRARVLQRFAKVDKSRGTDGQGLGLSLVKAICQLHQFTLRIGGDGDGAIVSIECFH